ncbi:putative solute carrier organic anion transporter family member 1A4 [Apostichopus japonicus]|uniref:Putative solute carrier organic anion transporter family member 1A4 n=1 Tax=Stichopus japonicus TaxID=307972 RepID=A0A2G8KW90_STIJA|nr:putative solute carrier organic anion transporter family member 1A4 [Apostichopus japonicus]
MLPPGLFGNLLGGIVVRIFGNTRLRTVTIVVVLGVVVMLLEPLFLIFGCKNGDIAGLTVHYQPEGATMADIELPNLDAGCHEGCGCKDQYTPVCGSDGVTYATACFAGCQSYGNVEIEGSNTTVYLDCACIPSQETSTFISGSDVVDGVLTDQYAVQGACPLDPPCQSLLPFLILSPLIMTIGTMLANPISILQIRSVDLPDRPVCLAMGNILGKLFGFLPAPIIYGAIIDSACLMFQSSCGQSGSCIVYDIEKYRFTFHGLNNVLRVLGTLFLFVAYLSVRLGWDAKKPKQENENQEEKEPMKKESNV